MPVDEIKAGIAQFKGSQAYELLQSEILKETFDHLEKEYITAWRRSAEANDKARERLWMAVRVLDHVKTHLAKLAADGRLATKDLAQIQYLKR